MPKIRATRPNGTKTRKAVAVSKLNGHVPNSFALKRMPSECGKIYALFPFNFTLCRIVEVGCTISRLCEPPSNFAKKVYVSLDLTIAGPLGPVFHEEQWKVTY